MQSYQEPTEKPRVLLFTDDEQESQALGAALKQAGAVVTFVGSADEAVTCVLRQPFDVLIGDTASVHSRTVLTQCRELQPWAGALPLEDALVSLQAGPEALEPALRELRPRGDALALQLTAWQHLVANACEAAERLRQHILKSGAFAPALWIIADALAGGHACDSIAIASSQEGARLVESRVCRGGKGRYALTALEAWVGERYDILSGGTEPHQTPPALPPDVTLLPVTVGRQLRGVIGIAYQPAHVPDTNERALIGRLLSHLSHIFGVFDKMHRSALRDPLTNLLNRIGLEAELEHAWSRARDVPDGLTVVVLDIDNFKVINDSYGHAAGDEILEGFSRIVSNLIPPSGVMGRYGGDEFQILLHDTPQNTARQFILGMMAEVSRHIFSGPLYELNVTSSAGMAWSHGTASPGNAEALLSQADRALYMSKRAGRNRLCVWPSQPEVITAQLPALTARSAKRRPLAALPLITGESAPGRILIVDDEAGIRGALTALLTRQGYEIEECASADAALALLAENPGYYDVLLTDLSMPTKDGIALMHEVSGVDAPAKVVMTGYATTSNAIDAMREGAYDFVTKPFGAEKLYAVIRRAVEYRRLLLERTHYLGELEQLVQARSAQLAASLEEVRMSREFTMQALASMLNAHEPGTGQHSVRTHALTLALARAMGLRGKELENAAQGGLLHDIGKIGISQEILDRPGKLTDAEWALVRSHPKTAHDVLMTSPYLREVAEIVYAHHERFDGTGYPRGLQAEAIPLGARIFAVVDAYDAMRSQRSYSGPLSPEEAAQEIELNSGTQFDPAVVAAFRASHELLERVLRRYADG